ncbi:MAG TPA: FtsW/RodA/SpoVE family cell cycle protein [Fimbriimonadaceae bacterium]|nr:FtsW/RodA/SpoVE family cell cycle protein [Fimbriimonadaceae bacterium]HRJ32939.1 FtsW/RodA/SpoVE family cell cycle protein [Fimbriimonadaceae bacterium]
MIRLQRSPALPTTERRKRLAGYDGWLILSTVVLLVFGLMALYSIAQDQPGQQAIFKNHVIRLGIGMFFFAAFFWVPLTTWRKLALPLYGLNLVLLLLVEFAGQTRGGAQRWIQFGPIEFQPSEMAKLVMVLMIAQVLVSAQDQIRSLGTFLRSLLWVLPPALLVFFQPHLGATLVLFVSWLAISVVTGVRWRWIVAFIGLGALAIPAVMLGYQRERVEGLLRGDNKTNAYQQHRAAIAFAEGGVLGTGYGQGEQKRGGYIPEQETDFVVTTIGEEGGLMGMTLLISAFSLFFGRIWWLMVRTSDPYKRAVAAGIFAVLGFHTVLNLGMNLSITPVVGLWLPFLSFGGTALWLCCACVGLLLQLSRQGEEGMF